MTQRATRAAAPSRRPRRWSRFRRNRAVWDRLERYILPALYERARRWRRRELLVWCAGCGAGEEPYTLLLVHELMLAREFAHVRPRVIATDADDEKLARARAATYPRGALRGLPADWIELAFRSREGGLEVRPEYRRRVSFRREDLRERLPRGPLGLVLCRGGAFGGLDETDQRGLLERLYPRMRPEAFLVIGARERLPAGDHGFIPWRISRGVWIRSA